MCGMDGREAGWRPRHLNGLLREAELGRWEQKDSHEICGNAVQRAQKSQIYGLRLRDRKNERAERGKRGW